MMIIELYLDSTRLNAHKTRPTVGQAQKCTANYASIKMEQQRGRFTEDIYRGLTDRDRRLIVLIEELAKDNDLEVKIYDLAKFRNSFRAYVKGVRMTPTVIIEKDKFEQDFLEVRNLVALDEWIQKKVSNKN